MEDGFVPITEDDVAALSTALKYPKSLFYRRDVRTGAFNGLYRRRKSLGAKFISRFNASILIRVARVERMAQKDAVVKSDLPECDPDEYAGGAVEIAAHVRQFLGIPPGPIRNLIEILEDHGVVVIRQDFGSSKIDGVSIFSKGGRPIIFVNETQAKSRQIFTAVHELAHMVMHRYPRPDEIAEREGDEFTAEFAMPADDIRRDFASIKYLTLESLQNLKIRWNVSMAALLRRARDLGFIDGKRYTSLNIVMSGRGYKRAEPFEQHIKLGTPTFERELIDYHINDLHYSEEQLCNLLDMTVGEFRETYAPEADGLRVIK